jgi:hypothetical protein
MLHLNQKYLIVNTAPEHFQLFVGLRYSGLRLDGSLHEHDVYGAELCL